ncbi:MAG: hypothetical protein KAR00_02990 [Candidatus Pacebacteria bacterium]|nr:hypothetical protein [Candidatus Paceibacterota bacterium]
MKKAYISLVSLIAGTLPLAVSAQGIENPLKGGIDTLGKFVEVIVTDIVIPIGAVIVVLAIIYSGFLFVTAQGNPEKLEVAKRAFLWSAIGAIILLGAWVIAQVIENTISQITG